jgi:hypothetical protein
MGATIPSYLYDAKINEPLTAFERCSQDESGARYSNRVACPKVS